MVKAQDFWNFICNDLDYRFFAGVPCIGLDPLYKNMNPEFMHYIPAANERLALGLVSGAYFAGLKGGILIDMRYGYDLVSLLNFNITNKIPFLIIGYSEEDSDNVDLVHELPKTILTTKYKTRVSKMIRELETKYIPGILIVGEGMLS
jgi:sulfopyruvate decarboxylase TPP-binding subunit